jgi:hypothetical protein
VEPFNFALVAGSFLGVRGNDDDAQMVEGEVCLKKERRVQLLVVRLH